jgi:AcrR family transcriptional regulator
MSMTRRALRPSVHAAASEAPTKRKIEDTATALFAAKGFEATGIREIADGVGVTSSALYHYMGSKEELLVAIMTGSMRALLAAADVSLSRSEDPPSRLVALVRTHVGLHAEDPLRARVSDDELRVVSASLRGRVMELRDAYESLWADTLEAGCNEGFFHIANAKIARLALLEMCNGVTRWYSPHGPMSSGDIADAMADLSLSMVDARRGRRRLALNDLACPPIADVIRTVREALGAEEGLADSLSSFDGLGERSGDSRLG